MKTSQSYSLVYFSDHGLNFIEEDDDEVAIFRDQEIKQSYEIPFLVTSSDFSKIEHYQVTRSSLHLMDFFANWLGVKTDRTIDDYDIFNAPADDAVVTSYDDIRCKYSDKQAGLDAMDISKVTP